MSELYIEKVVWHMSAICSQISCQGRRINVTRGLMLRYRLDIFISEGQCAGDPEDSVVSDTFLFFGRSLTGYAEHISLNSMLI